MKNYLNFEDEIKNLESEIDKLKDPYNNEGLSEVDTGKISKIQNEIDQMCPEGLLVQQFFFCNSSNAQLLVLYLVRPALR